MKTIVIIIFSIFLMVSTAYSQDSVVTEYKPFLTLEKRAQRAAFVGKWSSKQPTNKGGIKASTIIRSVDSSYILEHKIYDKQSTLIQESKEVGIWGVSGGIYFSVFRGWLENEELTPADPSDAYNYDAYRIEHVEQDKLVYENLSSGNKYTYHRVN